MKISSKHGIKNKLITNGKLLTKETLDKIHKYLDSITLSIDSVDDNINESLGRGKNHFSVIKDILDYINLKGYDLKIRINTVICKKNLEKVDDLIYFLNNYKIYSWRIFKFMPLREKATKNKEEFEISIDRYNDIVKLIKDKTNITNVDTRIETDMESKYILILANGNIVVTENSQDKIIGNALNDSLVTFI